MPLANSACAMEKLSQPQQRATATVNYLGSFSPPPRMNQPCTATVQRWGIEEKHGPRVAVPVQPLSLLHGHDLARPWGRLRRMTFKWPTYICWRAAHRRLPTTAVPPRGKACKRREGAGELRHPRILLPVPVRQTAHRLCQERGVQLT